MSGNSKIKFPKLWSNSRNFGRIPEILRIFPNYSGYPRKVSNRLILGLGSSLCLYLQNRLSGHSFISKYVQNLGHMTTVDFCTLHCYSPYITYIVDFKNFSRFESHWILLNFTEFFKFTNFTEISVISTEFTNIVSQYLIVLVFNRLGWKYQWESLIYQ